MRARLALSGLTAAVSFEAAADFNSGSPEFAWPVDCTLGQTCYVQNYVDHDPGPGWLDFTCNTLSYDGHKGTDIALPTHMDLEAGVDVLAAAPGIVRGIRDEMPDEVYSGQDLEGRDCGNGVVIDHGAGWVSQYCHLKRASVVVAAGDRVATGQILGEIGLSGRTEFPHLHLSLRQDGQTVDPFNPQADSHCLPSEGPTLWTEPVRYNAGGLLSVGFSTAVPEYSAVKQGNAAQKLMRDAPIVLYGFGYGMRRGDVMRLTIFGPNGREVFSNDHVYDRNRAQSFRAGGRRPPPEAWPAGEYLGVAELRRDDVPISVKRLEVRIP